MIIPMGMIKHPTQKLRVHSLIGTIIAALKGKKELYFVGAQLAILRQLKQKRLYYHFFSNLAKKSGE
jgi:hypothetical protein